MKNILMNTEMAKAILDGRKVQTRRVIKFGLYTIPNDMNEHCIEVASNYCDLDENNYPELKSEMIKHAKYQIGEAIWVREPVKVWALENNRDLDFSYNADNVAMTIPLPNRFYDKDNNTPKWTDGHEDGRGIPNGCIKEMARIFLKITDVRVERLQDISDNDILKEGINDPDLQMKYLRNVFIGIWNKTAPKGYKWEDNPYVFVYEFEKVENPN